MGLEYFTPSIPHLAESAVQHRYSVLLSLSLWPGVGALFTLITNSTGKKLLVKAPGNE